MTKTKIEREERKLYIRETALKLFSDRGFAGTTMDDIVNRTGISKGGIYYYYNSKDEIFRDLMIDALNFRKETIIKYLSEHADKSIYDIAIDMILDKIMEDNPYKTVMTIYIMEFSHMEAYNRIMDENFKSLKKDFLSFLKDNANNINYEKQTDKIISREFNFFVNSLYVGAHKIPITNRKKTRDMLNIMIKAYLTSDN